jgi:hypothetical protein
LGAGIKSSADCRTEDLFSSLKMSVVSAVVSCDSLTKACTPATATAKSPLRLKPYERHCGTTTWFGSVTASSLCALPAQNTTAKMTRKTARWNESLLLIPLPFP